MPRKNFKVDLKMETLYTFDVKAVDIHEMGQLHGTWGSLAIIVGEDSFEIIGEN